MKGCGHMKKLICAKDVEALAQQAQKVMYIDEDTLITPSARDAASAEGIEFSTRPSDSQACCQPQGAPSCSDNVEEREKGAKLPEVLGDRLNELRLEKEKSRIISRVLIRLKEEGLI